MAAPLESMASVKIGDVTFSESHRQTANRCWRVVSADAQADPAVASGNITAGPRPLHAGPASAGPLPSALSPPPSAPPTDPSPNAPPAARPSKCPELPQAGAIPGTASRRPRPTGSR